MTKPEKAYFTRLVNNANSKIQGIIDGTELGNVFKSRYEKKAAIMAISNAMEPLAEYLKLEITNVDLNQLNRIKTPRGTFKICFETMEEAEENGWNIWFTHDGYVIVENGNFQAVAVERQVTK